MAKFRTTQTRPPRVKTPKSPKSPIKSKLSDNPVITTYEGAQGSVRKTKSELFLLAVANMVSEDTFYEGASDRDKRFLDLIHKATQKDPQWVAKFIPWLRAEANMRSAAVVAAIEYARTLHNSFDPELGRSMVIVPGSDHTGRLVIANSLQRADEPAEALAYYVGKYGRKIPMSIKRGIADAVVRLYSEFTALKYDGQGHDWRMGDVIDLVHPSPKDARQSALFRYLLDVRHKRDEVSTVGLDIITANRNLEALSVELRRPLLDQWNQSEIFKSAAFTWERLSGWLQGPMDKKAWETIIPSMGYFALLRNLRNFDGAGISESVKDEVIKKLTDPEEVAKSRLFPIRFFSAYRAVQSLDWGRALEKALTLSIQNVPALKGRTLIMVDDSGSMNQHMSARSELAMRDIASMFGSALALRAESVDLYGYADTAVKVPVTKGTSVLRLTEQVQRATNGGTRTIDLLAKLYSDHDRVIILTDEQAFAPDGSYTGFFGGYDYGRRDTKDMIGHIKAPIFTFNLAGYKTGMLPSGSGQYHTFGGLSDGGFKVIELLERGLDNGWPWE